MCLERWADPGGAGGALRGPAAIVLEPGENILAAATAGEGGVFLFATWTAPSRIIKFQAGAGRQGGGRELSCHAPIR